MADFVIMPRLGQSMEEGTVLQWFKQEGDSVRAGEPLLEVMSDKANFEVEATCDGTVRKILAQPNSTVPVNEPVAIVGSADESIDALLPVTSTAASSQTAKAATVTEGDWANPQIAIPESAIRNSQSAMPERISVSPRARRLADARGIAVAALAGRGTGPGGRVLERDVTAYLEDSPTPSRLRVTPLAARLADDLGVDVGDLSMGLPGSRVTADVVRSRAVPPPDGGPAIADRIPLISLRKIIADNVTRSRQTTPHVTLVSEADMTDVVRMFPAVQAEILKNHDTKVTYTDLLVYVAARALKGHPLCNAALVGDEIQVFADMNVGVAVAVDSGLLVPVIRQADRKSLGEISAELKEVVARCRAGRQTQEDLSGGTFTITNLGSFGIDSFDPIIVPPQSCILGVGRIAEKVVALNGQSAVRSMMNLCLSFDHRVLDGAPAARFVQRLKTLLETPVLAFM